jgi:hypothetical protein
MSQRHSGGRASAAVLAGPGSLDAEAVGEGSAGTEATSISSRGAGGVALADGVGGPAIGLCSDPQATHDTATRISLPRERILEP